MDTCTLKYNPPLALSAMGRALELRAKGPGFKPVLGNTYKLCSVDYNVHIRLIASVIIMSIYVCKYVSIQVCKFTVNIKNYCYVPPSHI